MKVITKEEIKEYLGLTVGELKEFINKHNLPDDAKVLIERVEDKYYENHGWGVYLKDGIWDYKIQYHPALSCVKYVDENENLFIDLHY